MEFVDWNKYSLDELVEYLEDKYRFNSSGEALAIHKLIAYYRESVNKLNERNSVDEGEKSFATCDECESYYYCKFHKQCKLYWKKMTSK